MSDEDRQRIIDRLASYKIHPDASAEGFHIECDNLVVEALRLAGESRIADAYDEAKNDMFWFS